jgi:hypothetical protein
MLPTHDKDAHDEDANTTLVDIGGEVLDSENKENLDHPTATKKPA